MEIEVKRIDQLGIVAGIVKDLGIINLIDDLIGRNIQEEISAGETIAGMILNGLGFVSRPLMLTPQFFEHKALDVLIRDGVKPEHFNRHKIGRVLDRIGEYGCEKLFSAVASSACIQENVNMNIGHLDTTSYSLEGTYDSCSDTDKIIVTHGHSKAKRPDLKQVVQELITTNDGGIPFITKAFSGNASDSIIFRERAAAITSMFSKLKTRCLIADSKLYAKETAHILNKINFITRVPASLKLEQSFINKATEASNAWFDINEEYKAQEFSVENYGIDDQRWIVVYSTQAKTRSEKTLKKKVAKESINIKKELFHLQAQRFSCEADAKKELLKISKKWKFHQACSEKTLSKKHSTTREKPSEQNIIYEWQIKADAQLDECFFNKTLEQQSCFILATNISPIEFPAEKVLEDYKGQDKTEKGFAFLKSPEVFCSSFFLKKPSRIDGLLMIMVLSLLVYSIVQRRLRMQLALLKSTLPNQINKEIQNPTMRWIFQIFEGVNYVKVTINGVIKIIIEGLTPLKKRILNFFSSNIQKIYQYQCDGS